MRELLHRPLDVLARRRQLRIALQPVDLRLEEMAGREAVGEERVREQGRDVELVAAADADLDVARDGSHELGQLDRAERAPNLILERPDEGLLARDPVEVGVGVPEPDVVERLIAAEPLIPGMEVDRREARRAPLVVEVAAVDVDPDSSDRVDELAEALEVDRDQVVDRELRQLPDRLERAPRAAFGVRLVDPPPVGRLTGTGHVDHEIARKREQRDRVRRRVRSDEHDGVRPRWVARVGSLALVVADDQRVRRLVGDRDVEPLGGLLHVDGLDRDRPDHVLVHPEIETARERRGAHQEGDEGVEQDHPERRPARAPGRPGLAIDRDRRERPRR